VVVTATDPVQADARHEEAFPSGGVDQAEADDGRHLSEQA